VLLPRFWQKSDDGDFETGFKAKTVKANYCDKAPMQLRANAELSEAGVNRRAALAARRRIVGGLNEGNRQRLHPHQCHLLEATVIARWARIWWRSRAEFHVAHSEATGQIADRCRTLWPTRVVSIRHPENVDRIDQPLRREGLGPSPDTNRRSARRRPGRRARGSHARGRVKAGVKSIVAGEKVASAIPDPRRAAVKDLGHRMAARPIRIPEKFVPTASRGSR